MFLPFITRQKYINKPLFQTIRRDHSECYIEWSRIVMNDGN